MGCTGPALLSPGGVNIDPNYSPALTVFMGNKTLPSNEGLGQEEQYILHL